MRPKEITIFAMIWLLSFIVTLSANGEQNPPFPESNQDTPVAFVLEPAFEFEPVVDGKIVLHDFIIENTGGVPLSIEKITTTCGCTTAAYTKEISPGNKGKITVKANTNGYGGGRFSKGITVYTNAPNQEVLNLRISGQVDHFARIEPKNIRLKGIAGQKIEALVNIIPDKKYPFNILEASPIHGENIRIALEKKTDRYLLTVENLTKNRGRYFDRIRLKTDNPVKPEINIRVYGDVN